MSRFVGTALGAGDAAVVIARKTIRDGLTQRLKARGFDVAQAANQDRYIALDAAEVLSKFMSNGLPDPERFSNTVEQFLVRAKAAAEGENPRVVAFGEMVALLWAEGRTEAAIRLEQLWNDLAKTYSFNLWCGYPLAGFSADAGRAREATFRIPPVYAWLLVIPLPPASDQ